MYLANSVTGTISTISSAGVVSPFAGGFTNPAALTLDGSGNLYVADASTGNVSEITPGGVVSTAATGFGIPAALAVDGSGNLYVADASDGTVTEVNSQGENQLPYTFGYPTAIAFDGQGNLYVGDDEFDAIWIVTPSGNQSEFARGLSDPAALAIDGGGNVYVVSGFSGTVSKYTPAGVAATFASGFSTFGGGTNQPISLAFDGVGNLFVADANDGSISEVTPAGAVSGFASGYSNLAAIAILPAPVAPMITSSPQSQTVPASQNAVFSIDASGSAFSNTFQWQVSIDGGATWQILSNNTTYSGVTSTTLTVVNTTTAASGYEYECVVTNAVGSATSNPATLTCLPVLMYAVGSSGPSGSVSEITTAGGTNSFAGGSYQAGDLICDPGGNLYALDGDTISKITPAGVASKIGTVTEAQVLTCDENGNVYIGNYDEATGNCDIYKVSAAGVTAKFVSAFTHVPDEISGLACDANGNLYAADYGKSTIFKFTPDGSQSVFAREVFNPESMTFDAHGNLFVAGVLDTIYEITPGGAVSIFSTRFGGISGLAFDAAGNLYVAGSELPFPQYALYQVTPAGVVSTFADGSFGAIATVPGVAAPGPGNYSITPIANGGGTISPDTAETVTSGGSLNFIATPDTGYEVAQWLFDGMPVLSGTTASSCTLSNITQSGTLEVTFAQITTGSLEVTIAPSGAAAIGAEWSVDGGQFQDSGSTVSNLSAGTHTVSFISLAGYASPASQDLDIAVNQTTSVTGTYSPTVPTGSLEVTITPAGAVAAGAQWSVDGGPLQDSGATLNGVPAGSHTLDFSPATGYGTPSSQTINVPAVQTAGISVAYPAIGPALSNYFPLYDGDQKTFVYDTNQTLTLTVAGLGANDFEMTEASAASAESLFLQEDVSDCFLTSVVAGSVTLTLDPEILLLDEDILQNGGEAKSKTEISQSGATYPATFTVKLAAAGTVTVPAGTFYNCRSITSTEVARVPGRGVITATALTAYLAPGVGIIKLLVKPGDWAELVTGTVGGFAVTPAAVGADTGKYTILLTSTDDSAAVPSGTGYATMTVGPTDGVIMAGKLPDGEIFRASGLLLGGTAVNQFIIDDPLTYPSAVPKSATGSLAGTLSFVEVTGSGDIYGTLEWTKPEQAKGAYRAPIDTTLNVIGSRYVAPAKRGSVLPDFTGGTLKLNDTSTLNVSGAVTLASNNTLSIAPPNPHHLKVTITPSTGVFKGTFVYPGQTKLTGFGGVLFQDQNNGAGFFLGPDGSGTVSISSP